MKNLGWQAIKVSDEDKKKVVLETISEDPTFGSYLADLTSSGEPRSLLTSNIVGNIVEMESYLLLFSTILK